VNSILHLFLCEIVSNVCLLRFCRAIQPHTAPHPYTDIRLQSYWESYIYHNQYYSEILMAINKFESDLRGPFKRALSCVREQCLSHARAVQSWFKWQLLNCAGAARMFSRRTCVHACELHSDGRTSTAPPSRVLIYTRLKSNKCQNCLVRERMISGKYFWVIARALYLPI
jgi:hypothetical protein